MKELLNKIYNSLSMLKIPGCYLSLIDNESDLKYSRLVLGFNERDKLVISPKGIKYMTLNMLPDIINLSDEKFCLSFFPIDHRNNKIGYIFYEYSHEYIYYYESISNAIVSALDIAALILKLENTQKANEKLLETINSQNITLKKAVSQTKKANKEKTNFLAEVSHDIRTPINAIIGITEVVKSLVSSEFINSYNDIIIDESTHLIELLNQLLDISKIEAGKIRLIKNQFNIFSLIHAINNLFRNTADKKMISCNFFIDNEVPKFVNGDSLKLREILINLIGNSFKYTDKGNISITLNKDSETDRSVKIKFTITDTGTGIPFKKQKEIFKPFFQGENLQNQKIKGTGLGMSIAKKFVKLMNGEIGVISREGEGSTFWFTAEFDKIEEKNLKTNNIIEQETINKKSAKILVAEDYPTNQKIVSFYLKEAGHMPIIVDDGEKAVDKFAKEDFDLILMDMQMPVMDGITATKIIRSTDKGKTIPIIGFTANAFENDFKEFNKSGINDIIIKPFLKNDFLLKIMKWLNSKTG